MLTTGIEKSPPYKRTMNQKNMAAALWRGTRTPPPGGELRPDGGEFPLDVAESPSDLLLPVALPPPLNSSSPLPQAVHGRHTRPPTPGMGPGRG